jgi:excisionase family DNA binding protein
MMTSEEVLLTPSEVARLFRVDPKTVTRWAAAGRLEYVKTPGGHHRFSEEHVREVLRRNMSPPLAR